MKLSKQIIDGLIERKSRMRLQDNLYHYLGVNEGYRNPVTFRSFLALLVYIGAYEIYGKHYKLKDKKVLKTLEKKL